MKPGTDSKVTLGLSTSAWTASKRKRVALFDAIGQESKLVRSIESLRGKLGNLQ